MSKLNNVNLGLIGSGYMALTYAEAQEATIIGTVLSTFVA